MLQQHTTKFTYTTAASPGPPWGLVRLPPPPPSADLGRKGKKSHRSLPEVHWATFCHLPRPGPAARSASFPLSHRSGQRAILLGWRWVEMACGLMHC